MRWGAHFLPQIATLTPCLVIARKGKGKGRERKRFPSGVFGYKEEKRKEKKRKENTYVWLAKRGEIERKVYIFYLYALIKLRDREK